MTTVEQWFERYGESHQNPVNKRIHWICVPLITFSLLGLMWSATPWLALGFAALALGFYLRLSWPLAIGMALLSGVMLAGVAILPERVAVCVAIFVGAWIGQFIGHQIEGKKPSFFDDLKFLLIGPLWLLGFVYRRLRIDY
jgi:uncharacterized membrane protein YGL010W